MTPEYDIIVVGSGNAGFSAALSAREHGAQKVIVVDKCPPEWAGGNSYFTAGAYRTVFNGLQDVMEFVHNVDADTAKSIDMVPYSKDDFWNDLMRVTEGRADPELGRVLVDESRETVRWLSSKGIKFQLSFNRWLLHLMKVDEDKLTKLKDAGNSGEEWSCRSSMVERGSSHNTPQLHSAPTSKYTTPLP